MTSMMNRDAHEEKRAACYWRKSQPGEQIEGLSSRRKMEMDRREKGRCIQNSTNEQEAKVGRGRTISH